MEMRLSTSLFTDLDSGRIRKSRALDCPVNTLWYMDTLTTAVSLFVDAGFNVSILYLVTWDPITSFQQ